MVQINSSWKWPTSDLVWNKFRNCGNRNTQNCSNQNVTVRSQLDKSCKYISTPSICLLLHSCRDLCATNTLCWRALGVCCLRSVLLEEAINVFRTCFVESNLINKHLSIIIFMCIVLYLFATVAMKNMGALTRHYRIISRKLPKLDIYRKTEVSNLSRSPWDSHAFESRSNRHRPTISASVVVLSGLLSTKGTSC